MEQRANKKIQIYFNTLKDNIFKSMQQKHISNITKKEIDEMFDITPVLQLTKEDFIKRKRVKNFVPKFDRCVAKRANGEQCTRRKKDNCDYCGTHQKGCPHGIINADQENENYIETKIEIFTQDINGIIYYIDKHNNIYDPQDILNSKLNPKVIAKYQLYNDIYTVIDLK